MMANKTEKKGVVCQVILLQISIWLRIFDETRIPATETTNKLQLTIDRII